MASSDVRPIGGKKWFKNPWLLAAGGGAVLAVGTLIARKKASGNADSANSGVLQPANLNDSATGAYQNLQGEIESLQQLIAGIPANSPAVPSLLGDAQIHLGNGTSHPAGMGIIPGKLDQPFSLRALAKRLLPANKQNNPTAVEEELRRLIAVNPSWKGRTTVLGGHRFNIPAG